MSSDSRVVSIVPQAERPMSVISLKERAQHVQEVISSMMVEGVHYGVIPGTQNRSLLKEGTELLLSAFQIAIDPEIIETVGPDFVRYTVKVSGTHMGSGGFIGKGIGRASTNEEKYKWREVTCRQEWDATAPEQRREKWKRGKGDTTYMVRQVRTNPEDLAGTVLKMAKKRAQADLCLTALAASGAFKAQPAPPKDPKGPTGTSTPPKTAPGASQAPGPSKEELQRAARAPAADPQNAGPVYITSIQVVDLCKRLDMAGIPDRLFLAKFEIGDFKELPAAQLEAALSYIDRVNSP